MKMIIMMMPLLYFVSCTTTSSPKKDIFATAAFESKSGSSAKGKAWFFKQGQGVQVVVNVSNVSEGEHGIHIHQFGDCSAEDASSAGDHFNPHNHAHGSPNPSRYHMGDLGNVEVKSDGTGELKLFIPSSEFADWHNIVGKSLVLHAKPDDLTTQPAGASGGRIACAVITEE